MPFQILRSQETDSTTTDPQKLSAQERKRAGFTIIRTTPASTVPEVTEPKPPSLPPGTLIPRERFPGRELPPEEVRQERAEKFGRGQEAGIRAGAGALEGLAQPALALGGLSPGKVGEFFQTRFPGGRIGLIERLEAGGYLGEAGLIEKTAQIGGNAAAIAASFTTGSAALRAAGFLAKAGRAQRILTDAIVLGGQHVIVTESEAKATGIRLTPKEHFTAAFETVAGITLGGVAGGALGREIQKAAKGRLGKTLGEGARHLVIGGVFGGIGAAKAETREDAIANVVGSSLGMLLGGMATSRLATTGRRVPRDEKQFVRDITEDLNELETADLTRATPPKKPLQLGFEAPKRASDRPLPKPVEIARQSDREIVVDREIAKTVALVDASGKPELTRYIKAKLGQLPAVMQAVFEKNPDILSSDDARTARRLLADHESRVKQGVKQAKAIPISEEPLLPERARQVAGIAEARVPEGRTTVPAAVPTEVAGKPKGAAVRARRAPVVSRVTPVAKDLLPPAAKAPKPAPKPAAAKATVPPKPVAKSALRITKGKAPVVATGEATAPQKAGKVVTVGKVRERPPKVVPAVQTPATPAAAPKPAVAAKPKVVSESAKLQDELKQARFALGGAVRKSTTLPAASSAKETARAEIQSALDRVVKAEAAVAKARKATAKKLSAEREAKLRASEGSTEGAKKEKLKDHWEQGERVIEREYEPRARDAAKAAADPKKTPAERDQHAKVARSYEQAAKNTKKALAKRPPLPKDVELQDLTSTPKILYEWARRAASPAVRNLKVKNPLLDSKIWTRHVVFGKPGPERLAAVEEKLRNDYQMTADGIRERVGRLEAEIGKEPKKPFFRAGIGREAVGSSFRDRFIFTVSSVLRSFGDPKKPGDPANILADMVRDFLNDTDQAQHGTLGKFSRMRPPGSKKSLIEPLSAGERGELAAWMDYLLNPGSGLEKPKPPSSKDVSWRLAVVLKSVGKDPKITDQKMRDSVDEAAEATTEIYRGIANQATDLGLFLRLADGTLVPWAARPDFWPLFFRDEVWQPDPLARHGPGFEGKTAKALFLQEKIVDSAVKRNPRLTREEAYALLERHFTTRDKPPFRAPLEQVAKFDEHLESPRHLDTMFGLEWDPAVVVPRYSNPAIMRLRFVDYFGRRGEVVLDASPEALKENPDGYGRGLVAEAGRQGARMDKMIEYFNIATEQNPDTYNAIPRGAWKHLFRESSGFIFATKLGLSPLAQAVQLLTPAAHTDFKTYTKSFKQALGATIGESSSRFMPEALQRKLRDNVLADMIAQTGAMREAEHIRWVRDLGGFTPKIAKFAMENVYGNAPADRLARRLGAIVGMNTVTVLGTELAAAKSVKNAKAIETTRQHIRHLFPDKRLQDLMERWDDLPETGQYLHRAAELPAHRDFLRIQGGHTIAFRTSFRTRPADLPLLQSHPVIGHLYKLQTFAFRSSAENYRVIMETMQNPAARNRFLGSLAFVLPGIAGLHWLREQARHRTPEEIAAEPGIQRFARFLAFAGVFPVLNDWYLSAANLTRKSPAEVAKRFTGPIFGSWIDMAPVAADLVTGNFEDVKRWGALQLPTTVAHIVFPELPTGREIARGEPVFGKVLVRKRKPGQLSFAERQVAKIPEPVGPPIRQFFFGTPKKQKKAS